MATNATTNLSGFLRRLTLEMAAETLSNLSDQQLIANAVCQAQCVRTLHVSMSENVRAQRSVGFRVVKSLSPLRRTPQRLNDT